MLLDIEGTFIVITGDLKPLFSERRILAYLKSLNAIIENDRVLIDFSEGWAALVLKKIQDWILNKFNIKHVLSENVTEALTDYLRESENFSVFSNNARKIRNDEFADNPELVDFFDDFQRLVSEKIRWRKLYGLQMLSAFHMAFSQNSCNFAVPGAGKTSIVYAAYAYLKSLPETDPRHVDRILVIGPISSFKAWEDEYRSCFLCEVESIRMSWNIEISKNQKIQHLYSANPKELTLIEHGYISVLEQEIRDFLKKNKTMIVVDEAHKIKNPDSLRGASAVEISKDAISRIILTGTPIPNGYQDLYNLYRFIYPYRYPDILKIHLSQLEEMTKSSDGQSSRVKDFMWNISPYFIRIKKKDLNLPRQIETKVSVVMDPRQKEIYEFIESEYVKSFRSSSSPRLKELLNKAKLIRLRQAAINPALLEFAIKDCFDVECDDESIPNLPLEFQSDARIKSLISGYSKNFTPPKFIETLKIIQEDVLPLDEKVIIWTIFIQNAKLLKDYLKGNGISSELLIWEVDTTTREGIISKFNDPKNSDFAVVIANPFSVAESISLHKGCHNAIYIERDYNCANFLQSKDRIHRVWLDPNQDTRYYYLNSLDTIDEIVDDRLDIKVKRMEKLIDSDIPLFSRMDDSDETDLVKALLRKYAGKI